MIHTLRGASFSYITAKFVCFEKSLLLCHGSLVGN